MLVPDLLVLGVAMVAVDQEFSRSLQHRHCIRGWMFGSHGANRSWLRDSNLESKNPSAMLGHLRMTTLL